MIKWAQTLSAVEQSRLILTQVASHQIGAVEILHAKSNNVDEFLYDLHQFHCSGVDLDKIKRTRGMLPLFHKLRSEGYYSGGERVQNKKKKIASI